MPNASESTFFAERQPAAVLKHGILRRYIQPFTNKTGKWAPDHRVVYLDGYSGPGVYSDGAPGSPAWAVQTAETVAGFRNLLCVEPDEDGALAEPAGRAPESGYGAVGPSSRHTVRDHS